VTRAELGRLTEGQVVHLPDLTVTEAAALNASRLLRVEPSADGWIATAEHAVGAVHRGDLTVRVSPKVGAIQVLTLLARAHGIRGLRLDDSVVEVAPDADLSVVLAALFVQELRSSLAGGLIRGYRSEDQTQSVLRGRVRLREQHLRRFGLPIPLEVSYDEWTLDTDENRRIRAACRRLLGLPGLPDRLSQPLHRFDRALRDVWIAPVGARLSPWTPTRLNSRLHRLLHLCDLVLAHASVEIDPGAVQTSGLVVNMAWLFELLVAELLAEHAPGLHAQHSAPLDSRARLRIRPDLLLLSGSGMPIGVADTKYKMLDEDCAPPLADAYQMTTYCTRFGLATGHLIYAMPGPDPEPFDLLGTTVRLVVHTVDLSQPIAEIEARVASLAGTILGSALRSMP
jgi:5-methylcytosine-specific restriction enzyme subunit McrC